MTCTNCGAYAPPDQASGYDADDLCPACAQAEETRLDEEAQAEREADPDYWASLADDAAYDDWKDRQVFGE